MIYIAIDFETANYWPESACAVAMVKFSKGKILGQRDYLIKPPQDYFVFTHIHGITSEHVSQAPSFAELWPEINAFAQDAHFWVAHNAAFDCRVLTACCKKIGHWPLDLPFLCTLKGSRRAFKLSSYGLNSVSRHLDISLNHHQALSDALATSRICMHLQDLGFSDKQLLLQNKIPSD